MNVVVDANLVAALVLPLPYSAQAMQKIMAWKRAGIELFAPQLLEYEVDAILRKAVVVGLMSTSQAIDAVYHVQDLNIHSLPATSELRVSALQWAQRLGHSKTYDAHCLALAEQLQAELWTADRRLVNGARQTDVTWVRWISKGEV